MKRTQDGSVGPMRSINRPYIIDLYETVDSGNLEHKEFFTVRRPDKMPSVGIQVEFADLRL